MPPVSIQRYSSAHTKAWNEFVRTARNPHFMFQREFMEYHRDRFEDHSLLFFENNKLCALLPAHQSQHSLISHKGLSFGGFLLSPRTHAETTLHCFNALTSYCRDLNIEKIWYRPVPHIYHTLPSEDDRYALYRLGARKVAADLSSAVQFSKVSGNISRIRQRRKKQALASGYIVNESLDLATFWPIVVSNLMRAHNITPVHSLDEIALLHKSFPQNIRLFTVQNSAGAIEGGALLFITSEVVHAQYQAATEQGLKDGVLDLLHITLLTEIFSKQTWFDFGHSTEKGGEILNTDLLFQKEGFGCRTVLFESYEFSTEKLIDL